jgi:hypothetical protein
MKTTTYLNILNQAAEMAGRTRDKIPSAEGLMLMNFLGMELASMWNRCCWPELCDNLQSYTPVVGTNNTATVSKNEGAGATEIGDVLGCWSADPRGTAQAARQIDFEIGNGQIYLLGRWCGPTPGGNVWIDWQLPAPDLVGIYNTAGGGTAGQAALYATVIPVRFNIPLSCKGASWLLKADGLTQQALVVDQGAEMELDRQSGAPEMTMPRWRRNGRRR